MTETSPPMADRDSARMSPVTIVSIALAVILVALVLPPLVFLLQGSVTGPAAEQQGQAFTFYYFQHMLDDRRLTQSFINSVAFSLGSAVVALFFGGLLAWIVERTNTPLKALAHLTAIISLGTPFVLYTGAWIFLLGKAGPVNTLIRDITGEFEPFINVYSLGGMILVEGFLWSPLVFLLLGATFRNANPELEEAARMSGASVWETFRRITFRLSLPAMLALAMLVFIRAFEAFEVPALIGMPGHVEVLTTEIYMNVRMRVPPDLGYASAFSVVLLAVVVVLLYFYGRLSRHAERFSTITGKGFRARPVDLGRGRYLTAAILVINFFLLLVAPLIALLWVSLLPFYQTFSRAGLKLLTLKNYIAVLNASHYVGLFINTLLIAAIAATIAVALTMVVAWLTVRRRPGGWFLDNLATFPLVFPGLVLGVAIMQLFLQLPLPLYGTIWVLVWAFVINFMPYGMRYSYSGMLQIHAELEEAAGVSGASALQSLRMIVAPLLAPTLIAAWLFIFLLGSRVLSLAILLAGPKSQTMAVAMYDLISNGQGPELAALGLMWTAFMTVIATAFHIFARRSATGAHGSTA
jgi:iron(III) transport system permease protein